MNGWSSKNATPAPVEGPPLFREAQRFRTWIFFLPLCAATAVVWYVFVQQVILGHPQGQQPLPNWAAWALTLIFGLGFPAIGATFRLVTEVRPGELRLRLFPFRGRVIPVGDIKEAVVRQYSAIGEFGGWGVRINRKSGRAYNAHGNMGVQLVLTDSSRVLVGSQRSEELYAALRQAGFGSTGRRKRS